MKAMQRRWPLAKARARAWALVSAGAAQLLSLVVRLWAASCRVRVHDDPRPMLRRAGRPYVYALLHAHQIAAVLANDEPRMAAMVSRSTDGDFLVPALQARRVLAARGSSRRGAIEKGGARALAELIALNRQGVPVLLAVDGPRGPRGMVHRGVVALAAATGAVILPVAVTASRSFVLARTWDGTQMPLPGATLHLRFAAGIEVAPTELKEETALRVRKALCRLESAHRQRLR